MEKKKILSLLLMVCILISILSVFPQTTFATNTSKVCLADLDRISWDRYTGNMGDSRLNILGIVEEYGFGNHGVDGTIYENGFEAWIARWNFGDNISWVTATYNLEGKYNKLTGSTGLIKSTNTTNFDTTAYFYNGDILLHSVRMTPDDWAHDFEVDVTGVEELKILVKDNAQKAGGTSFALYNMFLDDPLANLGTSSSNITSSNSAVYATEQDKILQQLGIETDEMLSNISCGNHPIKGPSVTFCGKTFYLFEFDGKLKLEFEGVPISIAVDTDTKTIKFLLGFDKYNGSVDISGENNDSAYWSQSYQKVKTMYQDITGKKVDTTKLWNQFSSVRGSLKKMKSDLLVEADTSVAGYMELSYESGTAQFYEGGIIMEASIGGEFSSRVPAFPAAYVVMGLEASVDGKISIAYEKYISMRTELDVALAANVGIGLGDKEIVKTYVEGGLIGTLGANMHFASGKFKDEYSSTSPVIVTVKGDVYLKGAFIGFDVGEKKWPIGNPVQLYPWNNAELMNVNLFECSTIDEVIANAKPLARDYLNRVDLLSVDDSDKLYSDTAVYDYNTPVITMLDNGQMMLLWIDDLGTKNNVNKTSLMYSIYDGTSWSSATEVFETGVYNGSPVIYNDGSNVNILWSKAKITFADDAGLADLIGDTELYYTCYGENGFSEPTQITQNDLFEINYDVISSDGKVAVAWTENTENDPYMTSGTNSVYTREFVNGVWQDKQLVKEDSQIIDEIEIFYMDDVLNCAYTMIDSENVTGIYNNQIKLGEGTYMNYYDNNLYYLSDSNIVRYDVANSVAVETGITGVNNFNVYEGNIYTLVSSGFKCELYESINTDGVFSELEQVTEFDRYIRDYSVTIDENNEPVYALNLVDVDTESDSIYGASELAVCKTSEIDALTVSAVYYDESLVQPGSILPLDIDVYNVGTTDYENLTVEISDGEGNNISTQEIEVSLPHGTQVTISCDYTLPEELSLHEIIVKVIGAESERNVEDNVAVTSIGYADIIVSDVTVERTDDAAVAKGTVTNTGYTDATNVVVSVYDSSYPDEILVEISCGDVAVGGVYNFEYSLPEKYLTLEDKMTMYGLSFKADSEETESNYANNTEKVVFGELTDYTIALVDDLELLDIISVDEFDSYSAKKYGYLLEGWYTSPTFEEESRITEIPEDISENMILYSNWNEIVKTDPVVTAPIVNTLTYTGEAQALISAGSTTGGTMQYSLDGVTYSEKIPTGITVGEYTVYYKVVGGEYYNDTEPQSITVNIGKAESIVVSDGATVVYGDSLKIIAEVGKSETELMSVADDKVGFYLGEIMLGSADVVYSNERNDIGTATLELSADKQFAIGKNTIEAVYSGSVNLNGSENDNIIITMNKRPLNYQVQAESKTYDGNAYITVSLTATNAVENDDIRISAIGTLSSTNVGEYTTVNLADVVLNGTDKDYYSVDTSKENVVLSDKVIVSKIAEEMPNIAVDYSNEIITGFIDGASYAINGTAVTPTNGVLAVGNYIGSKISIVKKTSGANHADSVAQSLTISSRLTAPTKNDFTVTQPSVVGGTGSISGITDAMEYSTDDGLTWTTGNGDDITDIAGGTTYSVRYKATDSRFKSESYTITIADYEDTSIRIELAADYVKALNTDSGILIVAGFDESGAMTKIEFIDGYEAELSGYAECKVIKAFLWNDLNGMLPICNNACVKSE